MRRKIMRTVPAGGDVTDKMRDDLNRVLIDFGAAADALKLPS